jgi:hypothetical protein
VQGTFGRHSRGQYTSARVRGNRVGRCSPDFCAACWDQESQAKRDKYRRGSDQDSDRRRIDLGSSESLIGVIIGVTGRDAFARTVGETGGDPMNPRIKTTVVGSYPVPSWLVGNTSRLVLRDAVMSVLKTQELAGLDLISDGELMRFDPSHPETNAPCIGAGASVGTGTEGGIRGLAVVILRGAVTRCLYGAIHALENPRKV